MSQIEDASYDAVVDKALLDCLIAERADRTRPLKMLSEIHRVLKQGGVFITVCAGQPQTRRSLLEREELLDFLSSSSLSHLSSLLPTLLPLFLSSHLLPFSLLSLFLVLSIKNIQSFL